MFKDSTVRLYNVDSGSYLDYLGQDYVNTVQGTHDIFYKIKIIYLYGPSRLFFNTHSLKNYNKKYENRSSLTTPPDLFESLVILTKWVQTADFTEEYFPVCSYCNSKFIQVFLDKHRIYIHGNVEDIFVI